MKSLILALLFVSVTASADDYISGYTRQNGSQVQPTVRSSADSSRTNNYGSLGNSNPYTGSYGTRNTYSTGSRPRTYKFGRSRRFR